MIGLNFVSGSGTSSSSRNPSFNVIEWDEEFMLPTNIKTYYMNLTQANANPDAEPEWVELHDMLNEYELTDLSPSSMKNFTERMYQDGTLASQFDWNKGRRGKPKPNTPAHEQRFRCLQTSEAFEMKDCYGDPHVVIPSKDLTSWFNYLIGNWIKIAPL